MEIARGVVTIIIITQHPMSDLVSLAHELDFFDGVYRVYLLRARVAICPAYCEVCGLSSRDL